ncbi:MAG: hypothetical protein JEY94_00145 [Melioribacteraceae bacterium]|nr:hypothetical protein [Melioribacteraceae bacterium]
MSSITVRKVEGKKDLMSFIKLPWKIYENDPNWVPHLIMERKQILDKKKNPFFTHGDMELYLAEQNGEIVGRIAAVENTLHNESHNENIGFFGFFECINNQDVANKLLDTAKEWIKNKGLAAMRGPANPSSNDEWAMLLEGFDKAPCLMMTYNPEYYLELMDNYGMKKVKDLYAYLIENKKLLAQEKLVRGAEIVRRRNGVTVRSADMKNFDKELERYKMVYSKAWAPNWGFVPLTSIEIDHMAKELKPLIDPDLILFMEKDGETIGAALVVPDLNRAIKKMNGKLFPFGILKFLKARKNIDLARVITLGVIPEHQKKGLDALFYYEITKRAEAKGIMYGEASWILEDNEMMNRGAKMMDGNIYKKYRVYEIGI